MKSKFSLALFVIAIVNLLSPILIGADYNQAPAQNYLLAHSDNPWSTMGLSALGTTNIPNDYLKNISGSSAINCEAPILAITSLNQDPRNFGPTDYVVKLKSFYTGSQIGDPTTLNDDIFGILALISAGVPPSDTVVAGSGNFLLSHQNSDGGWSFTVGGNSDSNTTASVIMALAAAGTPSSDTHIQNALTYLKTAQNTDGGFTYDPKSQSGTASDSSSTAWVLWALDALNISAASWSDSGHSPLDYLSANQTLAGYFEFQKGSAEDSFSPVTTAYAVIALSGKTLPLKTIVAAAPTVNFRIEGSAGSVCAGQVAAATAINVIKNTFQSCGFTYNIESTGLGPYLNQINSDTAAGDTGWLYLVNDNAPAVGAADYQTQNGDNILWYFGQSGWPPLKLDLPAAANSGQTVTATVQSYGNNAWSPLSGASVYFGTSTSTTAGNGTVSIAAPDGYYKVYAEKSGFIRSNSVLLKVGQPASSNVSLSANFSGGTVAGASTSPDLLPTIAFTVDSSSLNFGDINPGSQKTKTFIVHNTGSAGINLSASVSGDPLFTSNLLLNNKFWQNFSGDINAGQSSALTAALNVPGNFTGASGNKTGQLVLWASPK